ncbi:ATPase, partial [Myxococcota bacterium]
GHLLGFAHEQNRPDTPAACAEERQGTRGDMVFGSWDLSSIMNYCNPVWNNGGVLSGTDVAGAQFCYGLGERYVAAVTTVNSELL